MDTDEQQDLVRRLMRHHALPAGEGEVAVYAAMVAPVTAEVARLYAMEGIREVEPAPTFCAVPRGGDSPRGDGAAPCPPTYR
jgi:hypothetical protein